MKLTKVLTFFALLGLANVHANNDIDEVDAFAAAGSDDEDGLASMEEDEVEEEFLSRRLLGPKTSETIIYGHSQNWKPCGKGCIKIQVATGIKKCPDRPVITTTLSAATLGKGIPNLMSRLTGTSAVAWKCHGNGLNFHMRVRALPPAKISVQKANAIGLRLNYHYVEVPADPGPV